MKHVMKIILLISALTISGYSDVKPRDFFAASGITIGAPATTQAGSYKIPMEFETKIVHSGQWIESDLFSAVEWAKQAQVPAKSRDHWINDGLRTWSEKDPESAEMWRKQQNR